MKVLGLSVMFVGLSGALSKMLIIKDGRLSSYGTLMMIISLSLGTLTGELINIAKNDGGFTDAFVGSSLVVCVGAMAVVGSVMIFAVGVNSVFNKKFRVGNMLPALPVTAVYSIVSNL